MKIPFSQFRQFSAEGLFGAQTVGDGTEITIPLCQLLPRLKPEQFARRTGQKRIVVPDDIGPIFGPKGTEKGNLRIASEKKTPAPAAATAPDHAPAPAVIPAPSVVLPAPVVPVAPITPVTPIAPEPVAEAPAAFVQPAPAPEPISNIPLRAPNLDPSLATLKPTAPVPSRVVPSKTPPQATFAVALMDVAGFWAEKGRVELEDLYRHSLEIPVAALEAALKRGKVEFPWREVRPWVRLVSGNSLPTIDDETKVELPLPWIAPRFLEHQHKEDTRKKIEVGEDIPDVFVRNVRPEPATVPFPSPAAPAPAAPIEESKEPREFGEIFGQPDKKEWSLSEVSQRATTLPGVAGAIIGTSDGLLVGGTWPGADGNTVAAFAPQMYSRMTSYTKELQLGEPERFTLLIDNNVPLQIFKSADSYFTVLGRAGETLPAKELNAIATRLAASLTVK
jgi:predicted regulator of Ras-like GTPase activity (Roadblock/LC7/MglB family)